MAIILQVTDKHACVPALAGERCRLTGSPDESRLHELPRVLARGAARGLGAERALAAAVVLDRSAGRQGLALVGRVADVRLPVVAVRAADRVEVVLVELTRRGRVSSRLSSPGPCCSILCSLFRTYMYIG